ncbi:MAG: AAA family ATPase [Clostridia bacterium]|nr:AAA family ATPase [Clostridia bacterium]
MGMYLNPGMSAFAEAVNSPIFIDKTPMIAFLNSLVKTKQKYVSVSRPRRFGKTMAADMICAYYDREADSASLFSKLKLSGCPDWDKYLKHFDVLRLNMIDFLTGSKNVTEMLSYLTEEITDELISKFPDVKYGSRLNLRTVMNKINGATGQQFVIVIDEWDAVFREYPNDLEGQKLYLDFLRDLLKDKEYVALAYMTGILPIKKYGKHSALNMFDEYSMIYPLQMAQYAGFTEEEVRDLCNTYGRDYEQIKSWYDGYQVTDIVPPDPDHEILKTTGESPKAARYSLYSPLSVVKAVQTGQILKYWNSTETYEALEKYISMNYDGLKETIVMLMEGGRQDVDISGYQNDMTSFNSRDDILTMLIHLGYLSFDNGQVFIPNREVLDVFKTSTRDASWQPVFQMLSNSQRLLEATWAEDVDTVAALMEESHLAAGPERYHSEEGLSFAIQLAYYNAVNYYSLFPELPTGKGYADQVYIPRPEYADKPVLLIELKYEQSAETAIDQIHKRQYPKGLEAYKGKMLLVGINYNRDSKSEEYKHHTCVIERA